MIIKNAADFRQQIAQQRYPIKQAATMKAAFMVSPVGFTLDMQTAQDNQYMQMEQAVDATRALVQQMNLAKRISDCGIPVSTFPGSPETPDAVFPNNAFATAHNKRYIIGSMRYANRQKETQRKDIRAFFDDVLGYQKYEIEHESAVAELTGVLVPDRGRAVGFVGMTERVDEAGVAALHEGFQLDLLFQFELKPTEYHTNVVMACLAGEACVICPDSFVQQDDADAIADFYKGRTLEITDAEKQAFIGNCISITTEDVFFSQKALDTLTSQARSKLESWGFKLHGVDVSELEKAGGSLRCMVGEIF